MIKIRKFVLLSIFFLFHSVLWSNGSVVINVFVHGTYPAKKLLDHKKSPVRHMIHAEHGLSLAKDLPKHYHFYQAAIGCDSYDSHQFDVNHFYTWGWHSSNVRPQHRCNEGKKLYESVNELLQKHYILNQKITVRFIGSSHGGNVVLNALQWLPFDRHDVSVEVVLLGTPIQEHTRLFINCPYISKAYSYYSTKDWIQRVDAQRFHKNSKKGVPFWSSRTFQDSDRVLQIELKVNGKSISHGKYRRLFKHIPKMLCESDILSMRTMSNHVHLNVSISDF
ncbi:hypothetical protein KAZ82_00940 [Candidatus Babeliales bacterium]|nr:hypothetical protein [Candidatus Babeliales bacterium]